MRVSENKADLAIWLSSPNVVMAELACNHGFTKIVLDIEHGVFDLSALNVYVPFCRALGYEVFAKVLGPEAVPIQQALDYGANGVIIPHIKDADHARDVTAFAKYPPLGGRSYAGGRIVGYGRAPDGFFASENVSIKCYPMIESSGALKDVQAILALPTVDGVFIGPTDLALSSGRTSYSFDSSVEEDLKEVAQAAKLQGKIWIMPAWSAAERDFSLTHDVAWMVVANESRVIREGLDSCLDAVNAETNS